MANKWNYASLPATERIERIRGGDKDVYDSEIARSLDVIQSRSELGLDIGEQKDWIDTVSYNYNLSGAEKMGIPASAVSRSGYADLLLGTGTGNTGKARTTTLVNKDGERRQAVLELLAELYGKIEQVQNERKLTEEWLLNNGIDADSKDGKRMMEQTEQSIADQVERYQKEYLSALKSRLASI